MVLRSKEHNIPTDHGLYEIFGKFTFRGSFLEKALEIKGKAEPIGFKQK